MQIPPHFITRRFFQIRDGMHQEFNHADAQPELNDAEHHSKPPSGANSRRAAKRW